MSDNAIDSVKATPEQAALSRPRVTSGNGVEYPAASINVVAVGGTTLSILDRSGSYGKRNGLERKAVEGRAFTRPNRLIRTDIRSPGDVCPITYDYVTAEHDVSHSLNSNIEIAVDNILNQRGR